MCVRTSNANGDFDALQKQKHIHQYQKEKLQTMTPITRPLCIVIGTHLVRSCSKLMLNYKWRARVAHIEPFLVAILTVFAVVATFFFLETMIMCVCLSIHESIGGTIQMLLLLLFCSFVFFTIMNIERVVFLMLLLLLFAIARYLLFNCT